MLNLSLLKENYDSKFIETVANVYDSQKKFPNKDYFTKPGYYNQDLKFKDTEGETIDYFRAILYPPNLAILDYVLSNFDYFRDKVFLDYAAGFGLLSVFLKHIGIQCYNYDNFSQITNTEPFRKEILNSTGLSIEPVLDAFPDQKIDVLTCSGFWLSDQDYERIVPSCMLLDTWYLHRWRLAPHAYAEESTPLITVFKL